MASNSNGSDATKKSKSSTNENNNYNKNFSNHQKNQKSRNVKSSSNEKATTIAMDTNSNESGEKSTSLSADEGELSKNSEILFSHITRTLILDRYWKFRPPPRGFTSENYVLCQNFHENGICNFGLNCVNAHSSEELQEWQERFEKRKTQHENSTNFKSYTEELLERLHQSTNPEKIMKEKLDSVEVTCSNDLNLTVSSKTCKRDWIFVLKTTKLLKAVALLQDEHRTHFGIKHVFPMHPGKQAASNQVDSNKNLTTNDQEWTFKANVDSSRENLDTENETVVSHRVKIGFSTDIYGECGSKFEIQ
jgi:Zinc finger C-x8-C-x5-C-x3-H type (and similar)